MYDENEPEMSSPLILPAENIDETGSTGIPETIMESKQDSDVGLTEKTKKFQKI